MQYLEAPLHTIYLKSDLVTGFVTVGVRPCFPIEGVSFILGNDLAGGKVLVKPGCGDPGKEGKEPVAYGHAGENTDANPFAEYMWMENEEEYNRQVEELLEEEDQDWFIPSRDLNNQGVGQLEQQLNGLSANDHHSNLEEVARKSILNPEAKEFIPAGIMCSASGDYLAPPVFKRDRRS
ncbi:polyadenylate-binding protein-interacting protein 2B-like, partial [Cololabis saira]|uniref:polyadenylate-binding protein-interacting protein 2B-like n=1 Tax=Cololabis saira TaxID=129043 RepID=UPI002AD50101